MIRRFRAASASTGTLIWGMARLESTVLNGLCGTRVGNRPQKYWKRPKAKTCTKILKIFKSWHRICNKREDCPNRSQSVDYAHAKTENHRLFETVLRLEPGRPGRLAQV